MKTRVTNIKSPNNGNSIPNQFLIYTPRGVYFQSYQSVIAYMPIKGKIKLDSYFWNYSRTTSLNETTKETQKKIDSKEYILTNLN
jgi:hypothetical protein